MDASFEVPVLRFPVRCPFALQGAALLDTHTHSGVSGNRTRISRLQGEHPSVERQPQFSTAERTGVEPVSLDGQSSCDTSRITFHSLYCAGRLSRVELEPPDPHSGALPLRHSHHASQSRAFSVTYFVRLRGLEPRLTGNRPATLPLC